MEVQLRAKSTLRKISPMNQALLSSVKEELIVLNYIIISSYKKDAEHLG